MSDRFVSIRAEVMEDDDGTRFFRLSGDGWKDGEDTTDPSPSFRPDQLPVGTSITFEEPLPE